MGQIDEEAEHKNFAVIRLEPGERILQLDIRHLDALIVQVVHGCVFQPDGGFAAVTPIVVRDEVVRYAIEPGQYRTPAVVVAVYAFESTHERLSGDVLGLLAGAGAGQGVAVQDPVVAVVPGRPRFFVAQFCPADFFRRIVRLGRDCDFQGFEQDEYRPLRNIGRSAQNDNAEAGGLVTLLVPGLAKELFDILQDALGRRQLRPRLFVAFFRLRGVDSLFESADVIGNLGVLGRCLFELSLERG